MWKLGRIFGIDVSVHWTLVLMIAWTSLSAPHGGAPGAALFLSAIFGCVLLHELGHSLAARQFGIHTSSIVLLPIGGLASLESIPRKPVQELWIAVAGPLVNVVIAGVLFLSMGTLHVVAPNLAPWVGYLLIANVLLVAFNMLPAFPMDGGRVLRSLLAMWLPYADATQIAAGVGRIMALLLGIVGPFMGRPMLVLVAIFIFFAGAAEARLAAHQPAEPENGREKPFGRAFPGARPRDRRAGTETLQVIWDPIERRYRHATY